MTERLNEKTIEKVSSLLTWQSICKIAVEYMAFDLEELERIWLENMPHVKHAIVDVLKAFWTKSEGKDTKEV